MVPTQRGAPESGPIASRAKVSMSNGGGRVVGSCSLAGARVLPPGQLWVNFDGGLKTRGWTEVEAALNVAALGDWGPSGIARAPFVFHSLPSKRESGADSKFAVSDQRIVPTNVDFLEVRERIGAARGASTEGIDACSTASLLRAIGSPPWAVGGALAPASHRDSRARQTHTRVSEGHEPVREAHSRVREPQSIESEARGDPPKARGRVRHFHSRESEAGGDMRQVGARVRKSREPHARRDPSPRPTHAVARGMKLRRTGEVSPRRDARASRSRVGRPESSR